MKKILIADENADMVTLLTEGLSQLGLGEIMGTILVADAARILARHPVELVITGFAFSDGTGNDVIDHTKRWRPEAKIILFSGYPRESLENRGVDFSKIDGFLMKPVRMTNLLHFLVEKGILDLVPAEVS